MKKKVQNLIIDPHERANVSKMNVTKYKTCEIQKF